MAREGTLGTPAAMLPMLRLLVAFKPPNHVRLMLHGGDQPLLDSPIPDPLADDHLEEIAALVDQLAATQDHTGSVFPSRRP